MMDEETRLRVRIDSYNALMRLVQDEHVLELLRQLIADAEERLRQIDTPPASPG